MHLLRHGRTAWNDEYRFQGSTRDVPLNDEGRKESVAARIRLQRHFKKAYASPALRAQETASIIVPEVEVLDDLIEAHFGSSEGQIVRIGRGTQYPTLIHACVALQKEEHDKLSERIRHSFRHIITHEKHGDHLVVSHGYLIAYAVALLKNESRSAENLLKYYLANAGFHVITLDEKGELISAQLHAHQP